MTRVWRYLLVCIHTIIYLLQTITILSADAGASNGKYPVSPWSALAAAMADLMAQNADNDSISGGSPIAWMKPSGYVIKD